MRQFFFSIILILFSIINSIIISLILFFTSAKIFYKIFSILCLGKKVKIKIVYRIINFKQKEVENCRCRLVDVFGREFDNFLKASTKLLQNHSLAFLLCHVELFAFLGLSDHTLNRRFDDVLSHEVVGLLNELIQVGNFLQCRKIFLVNLLAELSALAALLQILQLHLHFLINVIDVLASLIVKINLLN